MFTNDRLRLLLAGTTNRDGFVGGSLIIGADIRAGIRFNAAPAYVSRVQRLMSCSGIGHFAEEADGRCLRVVESRRLYCRGRRWLKAKREAYGGYSNRERVREASRGVRPRNQDVEKSVLHGCLPSQAAFRASPSIKT